MPMVKVNDINMYYESHGEGDALVLISQPGFNVSEWKMHIPVFSNEYRVIIFDNRGAGSTDKPHTEYSIEMMAEDTIGLMNVLDIEKMHVLGVSGGGTIAQNLAYKYPKQVNGLVLVATMMNIPARNLFVMDTMLKLMEKCSPEDIIRYTLSWMLSNKFFENPEVVEGVIKAGLANPNKQPVHAFARQKVALANFDSRSWASKIQAPTLVIAGEDDVSLPQKHSKELSENIHGSKFTTMAGGHMFHMENPFVFQKTVMNFLASVK